MEAGMRILVVGLLIAVAGCSQGQPGASLVTNQEAICREAAAAGVPLVGNWSIKVGSQCVGSMKIDLDDPVPSGIWGCATDGHSTPMYQGTVRIGPSAAGVGLVFTSTGYTEAQIMRATQSGDTLTGTFDNHGDAPAPGAAFTATRQP